MPRARGKRDVGKESGGRSVGQGETRRTILPPPPYAVRKYGGGGGGGGGGTAVAAVAVATAIIFSFIQVAF
jgi:hypothetical protein